MFQPLMENVHLPEGEDKRYTNLYLRREMLVEFMKNKHVLYPFARDMLRYTYGLVGGKPVTIKEWVKKMCKNKEWGDSFCLLLVASWWSCRIGVVRSDCLEVITYRNKEGLDDKEVILLFNCSPVVGHYSAILRYDASVMLVAKVEKSDGYVWEVDLAERKNRGDKYTGEEGAQGEGESEFVAISKSRFMELMEIEKKYKDVLSVLGSDVKVVSKGGEDPDVVKTTPQKLAKRRLMEPAPEVQVVKTGDLHCNSCDQMFPSTYALERHVKRYHMDQ